MRPNNSNPAHARAGAYAPINGLRLYYEIHGSGKPLVLLHGGVLTIDLTFGPMIPVLAERHTVIAVELQGHGRTADTDREMTLAQLADDVASLLGYLAAHRAAFFGFSLGGLVALTLACKHPDLVERLVLASIAFRRDGYHSARRAADAAPAGKRPTEPADFRALEAEYKRVAPQPEHFRAFVAKTAAMVAAANDWSSADLREIDAPTLVLVGDRDCVRLEHALEMFELIPNAQLAVLPATGHADVTRLHEPTLGPVTRFLDAHQ